MAKPKRAPRLQPTLPMPVIRTFVLGAVAVAVVIWAMLRPKRPWPQRVPASPSGEIEIDLVDAG
jgi:hypothetical protein